MARSEPMVEVVEATGRLLAASTEMEDWSDDAVWR
jgi:hypothetical protein